MAVSLTPAILFRISDFETEEEFQAAGTHFKYVYQTRCEMPRNCIVIPRYAAEPYYGELVQDLTRLNCFAINYAHQQAWVTGGAWRKDLAALPKALSARATTFVMDGKPLDTIIEQDLLSFALETADLLKRRRLCRFYTLSVGYSGTTEAPALFSVGDALMSSPLDPNYDRFYKRLAASLEGMVL